MNVLLQIKSAQLVEAVLSVLSTNSRLFEYPRILDQLGIFEYFSFRSCGQQQRTYVRTRLSCAHQFEN